MRRNLANLNRGHVELLKRRTRSKFGNRKTVVDGITFDSAKEARRWMELCLLERAGEIKSLERQPRYDLFALKRDWRGKQMCEATVVIGRFTPDFRYRHTSGAWCVEDVKSPATRRETAYRLRKRIFEANYGITVTEI